MKKAYINWSGGKDAAYALYALTQLRGRVPSGDTQPHEPHDNARPHDAEHLGGDEHAQGGTQLQGEEHPTGRPQPYSTASNQDLSIETLVTTTKESERISMHGVHVNLLQAQAKAVGLPLHMIQLPTTCPMEEYSQIMKRAIGKLKAEGYSHSVFGDIALEDLKAYREEILATQGITGVFPLWKIPTNEQALRFIEAGFKAVVVCVNGSLMDSSFVGREFDKHFLADIKNLPAEIDPCGENGEFHSFVYDGPIFHNPVPWTRKEVVTQQYPPSEHAPEGVVYYFQDIALSK